MKITVIEKGGPGSGHHGHSGLKGVHGGSAPRGVGGRVGSAPPNPPTNHNDDMAFLPYAVANYSAPLGELFLSTYSKQQIRQAKIKISEDLAEVFMSSYDVEEDEAKIVASEYIKAWAQGSNYVGTSQNLQTAAEHIEELNTSLSDFQRNGFSPSDAPSETDKKFISTMYANTQKHLADLGYSPEDTITLYRGYVAPISLDVSFGDTVNFEGNALESWSMDPHTAVMFAKNGPKSYVVSMDVPVSRILSTPFTGFGCMDEFECVVLGNPKQSQQVSVFPNEKDYMIFPSIKTIAMRQP